MKTILYFALFLLCCAAFLHAEPALKPRPLYTLHTGDVLSLEYRYTPEFNQTVTIQPDGYVNLSIAGSMHVVGMTVAEAHDAILVKVSSQLNHPELNLVLKEFQKPYYVVAGEVEHTGRFDFVENTTALQAVMQAGGFKDTAQQSQVVVFRRVNDGLAEVHQINLKGMHKNSDLERDLVLQPGDMILVPRNKLEHLSRFMKAANLGIYFNPLSYNTP
jgi:polysaccharide export outer membrane protein